VLSTHCPYVGLPCMSSQYCVARSHAGLHMLVNESHVSVVGLHVCVVGLHAGLQGLLASHLNVVGLHVCVAASHAGLHVAAGMQFPVIMSHVSPWLQSAFDWHPGLYAQNPLLHVSPVMQSFIVLHCIQFPVSISQNGVNGFRSRQSWSPMHPPILGLHVPNVGLPDISSQYSVRGLHNPLQMSEGIFSHVSVIGSQYCVAESHGGLQSRVFGWHVNVIGSQNSVVGLHAG